MPASVRSCADAAAAPVETPAARRRRERREQGGRGRVRPVVRLRPAVRSVHAIVRALDGDDEEPLVLERPAERTRVEGAALAVGQEDDDPARCRRREEPAARDRRQRRERGCPHGRRARRRRLDRDRPRDRRIERRHVGHREEIGKHAVGERRDPGLDVGDRGANPHGQRFRTREARGCRRRGRRRHRARGVEHEERLHVTPHVQGRRVRHGRLRRREREQHEGRDDRGDRGRIRAASRRAQQERGADRTQAPGRQRNRGERQADREHEERAERGEEAHQ